VAKLALYMAENGELIPFSDLMPVYMRKAEAERKLEANYSNATPASPISEPDAAFE
jgi:hypothetical protein